MEKQLLENPQVQKIATDYMLRSNETITSWKDYLKIVKCVREPLIITEDFIRVYDGDKVKIKKGGVSAVLTANQDAVTIYRNSGWSFWSFKTKKK